MNRSTTDRRMPLLWTAVAAGVLLAGCDNFQFTADLATEAPSNPNITSVEVNLLGLDLRRDDGTDRTLEFSNPEVVNLLDLESGDPMRLFTDEELPAGHYVGVRLLFDLAERLQSRRQRLVLVVTEAALVRRVLVLTKLDDAVPIHDTEADALAALVALT